MPFDVRFWDIKKIGDNGSGGRYRVRWAVDDREHCKSFRNKTLADGFLDGLKDAARSRRPFSQRTGLPAAEPAQGEMITWYEHARRYAEAKWAGLAPVSRRSVAESLVTVTIALTAKEKGAPEGRVLRQALFGWAFNPATRERTRRARSPPPWAGWPAPRCPSAPWTTRPRCGSRSARAPRPWPASRRPGRRSGASGRCSTTPSATPSSRATSPPTRSTASSGPPPPSPQSVDRRVVVSPAQARKLLAAVRGLSDRGAHLEAFYACLYYAALRPRRRSCSARATCTCRRKGWGRIVLAASASRAGTAWTDHGTARQERGLKHRAAHETRTIPIPPELVRLLRAHIKKYGTTPDGRVFQTTRGGIIQDSAYSAVWAEARKAALTEAQFRSPLGRRPYDLRHAAVSLWLNSGVPATEVARRAGHGVAVLLKIYAHCIDGQADAANRRITDALGTKDAEPEPGDEEDGDSEQAS